MTPADPQKDSVLSDPGEVLSIKQEPEDPRPNLGSLGLQEITLDDGMKLGISLTSKILKSNVTLRLNVCVVLAAACCSPLAEQSEAPSRAGRIIIIIM